MEDIDIVLVVILLAASLFVNIFLFNKLKVQRKTIVEQTKVIYRNKEPEDAASQISGKWYGLCARNSIHSVDDFHRIVAADPLLASHFADFDWKNAHMGQLEEASWTHVTYRKDGMIRTTRRVIRLPKGDGYITDGKRWVRSYCCNDYVLAGGLEVSKAKLDSDLERLVKLDSADSTNKDVVPEPNTFMLFFTGLAGLGLTGFGRRRR